MNTYILFSLFALGTIFGSGLNALAYRLQIKKPWVRARSQCPKCGHRLAWWELIPLVSFIILRRRCSDCGKKISWQYPLVELAAGGLVILSYLTFGITVGFLISLAATLLLLFIYIYDGQTMLIPNPAVWTFNLIAFLSLFINSSFSLLGSNAPLFVVPGWWQLAAGPLLALPFLLLWLFSRGRAMGFADVKLALGIGWLLGIVSGFSAIIFAFWIGAAVSLALLGYQRLWKSTSPHSSKGFTMDTDAENADLTTPSEEYDDNRYSSSSNDVGGNAQKALTMKSAVPFGPFLILGFLIAFFGNYTLF